MAERQDAVSDAVCVMESLEKGREVQRQTCQLYSPRFVRSSPFRQQIKPSTYRGDPTASRARRRCVVAGEPLVDSSDKATDKKMTEKTDFSASPTPRDDVCKVLEDLIEGDRLYLAELLVIIDCYQRPLRIAMNSGLLPMSHQQLKAIFQNCDILLVFHNAMLPQLEGALTKSVIDFATTFSLFIPQLKVLYADVTRNYRTKYDTLSQCLANPLFSGLLENHHYSHDGDATQLKLLLKSPANKLEQYHKLLSEAVACSLHDSDEEKSLEAALKLLQGTKEELVSEISPYEEEQCIVEILHRKGPKAFLLTEPDCRLTKKGYVQIKLHSVFLHKCYNVKIFLFTSCLVFLSEKEKKQLNYILPLSGATIYEHVAESGEVTHLRDSNISIKSMKIYSPGGPRNGVVVLLETQAEKRAWFHSITEAIFHSTVDVDDSPLLQLPMQEVSLSLKRRSTTVHNEGYSVSNMFAFLLSPPTHHQQTFVNTFLLSYQLFTNGHEVLSFLSETHQKEVEQKTNHDKSSSTQAMKCLTCIKTWATNYNLEIRRDVELKRELQSYLTWVQEQKGQSHSQKQLVEFIERVLSDTNQASLKYPVTKPLSQQPLHGKFVDFNSQMVARQLTWAEHRIYCTIHPQELLNQRWTKKNKQELAPTVCVAIKRFNSMNNWAVHEILNQSTAKERKVVIQHMVAVAQTCFKLNNFATVFQLVAALTSTAIQRLQKTWELVSKKTFDDLRELQKIATVDGGSRFYRMRQREVTPPSVPYLGVYLNQLVSIEVGMPTFLPQAPEHINYSKLQKLAGLIEELCQFQSSLYSDIQPNGPVLMFFDKAVEDVEKFDLDKQFAKSEEMEPRSNR